MNGYRLYIFDLDKTLVHPWTDKYLEGVEDWFTFIGELPAEHRPHIAVATNQGGVGLRHWLKEMGKNYKRYRTQELVVETCQKAVDGLSELAQVEIKLYISFAYRAQRGGLWAPAPPEQLFDPAWDHNWRKPNPGMLLAAVEHYRLAPCEALMVGDSEDDKGAASRAKTSFVWAHNFFMRKPYENEGEGNQDSAGSAAQPGLFGD